MIINLTPHAVTVLSQDGEVVAEFPPSGGVARVSMADTPAGQIEGIPLVTKTPGEVVGLPEPEEGKFYVVSALVQGALRQRRDLLVPDDLVRDGEGRVIGCRRFSVNP